MASPVQPLPRKTSACQPVLLADLCLRQVSERAPWHESLCGLRSYLPAQGCMDLLYSQETAGGRFSSRDDQAKVSPKREFRRLHDADLRRCGKWSLRL